VLGARIAERVADLRRVLQRLAYALGLDVEDAQRARRTLLARLLVEHVGVLVEPRVQLLEIGGPALAVADRVELKLIAADAEVPQQ